MSVAGPKTDQPTLHYRRKPTSPLCTTAYNKIKLFSVRALLFPIFHGRVKRQKKELLMFSSFFFSLCMCRCAHRHVSISFSRLGSWLRFKAEVETHGSGKHSLTPPTKATLFFCGRSDNMTWTNPFLALIIIPPAKRDWKALQFTTGQTGKGEAQGNFPFRFTPNHITEEDVCICFPLDYQNTKKMT